MSDPNLQVGFDHSEPRAGWVLIFSIVVIITLIGTVFFVTAYYDQVHDKLVYERQELPINEDMRNLRTKEDNELHSYGYADKQAGLVRVPIERALELVASDAAAGKPKYPTTPYQVKKEEPVAPPAAQGAAPPTTTPLTTPVTQGGHAVAPAAAPHK